MSGRGSACSREKPQCPTSKDQLRTLIEVEILQELLSEPGAASVESRAQKLLEERIKQSSREYQVHENDYSTSSPDRNENNTNIVGRATTIITHQLPPTSIANDSSQSATCLEFLAWGRRYQRHYNATDNKTPNPSPTVTPPSLPGEEQAKTLVLFHIKYLAWHHNAMHSPTFLEQCKEYWQTGKTEDSAWVAFYLAVLSTAAWHIGQEQEAQLLTPEDPKEWAACWYLDMVNIWKSCTSMNNHSKPVHSVQAIAISTMIAHSLGYSNQHMALLGAANRIAQSLGMSRCPLVTQGLSKNDRQWWIERVRTQTARRVWWQLVIQDWFSVPFTDSYSIHPDHFDPMLPLNCDDHDMEEMPSSEPTISSYCDILIKMASLIPILLDGIQRTRNPISIERQYEHVLLMDSKMREAVSKFPKFLMPGTSVDPNWPEWVKWARRTLTISAADKIIMIHRSFLIRSFRSSLYAYTRSTCLSAALTIMREFLRIKNTGTSSLWIIPAFTVTAGIVISLDILHKPDLDDVDRRNREILEMAIVGLKEKSADMIAQRGAFLLRHLLEEDYRRRANNYEPEGEGENGYISEDTSIEKVIEQFLQGERVLVDSNVYSFMRHSVN